ncbi:MULTISPECIES: hypothetical protein [unclassified Roseateles]|uniref:hypothetical protein n=1 Tax=unclassified Roseateles TaxID=2626991 RepID=UPI0006F54A4E|nr:MULTISPECIES: hypothetical protein [unclassified Roseateles]KQW49989.1 hypothetical protein ASC81_24645 [Pelomonas sp. Root405]KRA67389.1 hypothetical protein ASD88_24645 [Pelomonas sp. Root662]
MADLSMPYPPELTKAQWDRNKGVMAKLFVGKTDIGAALTAVELEFKRGGYASIKTFDGVADPLDLAEYKKGLLSGLAKAEAAVNNKLGALKVIATAAHSDFAKSKTVPKSATTYVKGILDAITAFKAALDKFPGELDKALDKDFRERLHKTKEYVATMATAKSASDLAVKIINMVKMVEANPTVANVNKVFGADGPHRMLTTSFKTWDQFVKVQFPKLSAKLYAGTAMSDFFTLPHLSDIGNETNKAASSKLAAKVKAGADEKKVVTQFLLEYSKSVVEAQKLLKHFVAIGKVLNAV